LDGSTLDVADTAENNKAFGRPGASRGSSAYPKIRFVGLSLCQLDLAPFDALIWPHLVLVPPAGADAVFWIYSLIAGDLIFPEMPLLPFFGGARP